MFNRTGESALSTALDEFTMKLRRRRKCILLVSFGVACLLLHLYFVSREKNCSLLLQCLLTLGTSNVTAPRHIVDKPPWTCTLPRLDPFSKSVRHFIKNYSDSINLICGKSTKVFELVDRRLEIRDLSLMANVFEKSAKYEAVIRPTGEDNDVNYGEEISISQDGHRVDKDFVKVSYKLKNGSRKVELFAQIVEKPNVLKRKPDMNSLSVVLMGFDSTSNANFKRKLPKSFGYLVEKLNAFVFNGYSTVGDGTTPALTALLTGYSLDVAKKTFTDVDSWPWIMNAYKRKGYATLYAEDDPQVASFNKVGSFRKQPADHYIRPFWLAVERHGGLDGGRRNKSQFLHRVCLNHEPLHNITLNYVKDFLAAYKDIPKFAFPYFSYLPHGTGEKLSFADEDLQLFLRNYENYRNNTILIIFGDHGARVGNIRNTIQGNYEQRLPWLSMVLPSWFEHKYPSLTRNLQVNQDRVVSPFDLHETLRHVLHLDKPPSGTSLMSQLNPQRTCSDAGIDVHFCPCLKWRPENINSTRVRESARILVNTINKIISRKRLFTHLCFAVSLTRIIFATKSETSPEDGYVVYYQVTIATSPGDGLFQATFHVHPGLEMIINSHISRTNIYGRNPWCLGRDNHHMRRFCTCKKPHRRHVKAISRKSFGN